MKEEKYSFISDAIIISLLQVKPKDFVIEFHLKSTDYTDNMGTLKNNNKKIEYLKAMRVIQKSIHSIQNFFH